MALKDEIAARIEDLETSIKKHEEAHRMNVQGMRDKIKLLRKLLPDAELLADGLAALKDCGVDYKR